MNLKGHRLVGGMRASIYNAMPPEGIDKLVDFMEKFAAMENAYRRRHVHKDSKGNGSSLCTPSKL